MDTLKLCCKRKPKMVAHRGVSGLETENTLPAFIAAANRSYFGIETDVHVTADGRFIILHDSNPQRVGGPDCRVEESTFAELRKIVLRDMQTGEYDRGDLILPSLEEYLSLCKKYGKHSVLELKHGMTEENVLKIARIAKELGQYENVTFIAFDYAYLAALKKEFPDAEAQYLLSDWAPDALEKMKAIGVDLDIDYRKLTKETVDLCHENGIEVNVWTVDSLADGAKMSALGVDYITSNILE